MFSNKCILAIFKIRRLRIKSYQGKRSIEPKTFHSHRLKTVIQLPFIIRLIRFNIIVYCFGSSGDVVLFENDTQGAIKMPTEKQTQNNKLVLNQLSEYELIRGPNGISLFSDWHKPEEPEDCSWCDVAKACKTKGGY
jgi:hypothetical protein